jgi:hypothetical protein
MSFLWTLLSKPTHCLRVRIAECIAGGNAIETPGHSTRKSTYSTNYLDTLGQDSQDGEASLSDKALLDNVGESLARLGRVKRVGLGVKEKMEFFQAWTKTRSTW